MKRIVLILFLGFFCCVIKAQISTEEIPYSWKRGNEEIIKQSIPMETLPHLDMKSINQEDLESEGSGVPVRFGFSHEVNFTLSNSGTWQTTPDGGRLWNLRIYSPDALSLNLLYDKFWLPDGAKFFIYSEDKTQHIGAFTSENNKGDKENILGFATGFLFTNSIVLEYYEPEGTKESGVISICQTISGYRYIYDIVREEIQNRANSPYLLPCHNDVTCAAGNGYENERNAVACMIMGGSSCTGALLNTTANDNRPLFLSANHCFEGVSISTDQWIFYWNYEAPCGGNANWASNRSTTGANLLARRVNTDFLLLNLIEHPAMNSNISLYYLGWDRTTSAATSGAGIHHPRSSPKKISLTNSIKNQSSSILVSGITYPANSFWRADFYNGTTEGGSSGSPMLNQNRRVIGQLLGGTTGCPPNAIKYYGRLDVSWNGGGTSNTRLRDWLDPFNTNVNYLNGTDCHIALNNRTYNLGTHSIAGCTVEISNTTIESNTTVRMHSQQSVVLKPGFHAKAGSNVRITAGGGIASGIVGNSTDDNIDAIFMIKSLESAIETVGTSNVNFRVFPNPNDGNFTLQLLDVEEMKPYMVQIYNSSGALISKIEHCNTNQLNFNHSELPSGVYYVKLSMGVNTATKKVIIQ